MFFVVGCPFFKLIRQWNGRDMARRGFGTGVSGCVMRRRGVAWIVKLTIQVCIFLVCGGMSGIGNREGQYWILSGFWVQRSKARMASAERSVDDGRRREEIGREISS